jgi:hypothetical protein
MYDHNDLIGFDATDEDIVVTTICTEDQIKISQTLLSRFLQIGVYEISFTVTSTVVDSYK